MFIHPAFNTILAPQGPKVKLLDVKESISDLTTYTFTGCNLGDLGATATITGDTYEGVPNGRANSRKMIFCFVHGEDLAITFNVSSVTIGGVAGTEDTDRGGGTSAINTALYWWTTDSLQGITGTDVGVTFSEAVTGCAIGLILVENVGLALRFGTTNGVGTGALTLTLSGTLASMDRKFLALTGTTCAGTETVSFATNNLYSGLSNSVELYSASNAEFSYAAAYAIGEYSGGSIGYFSNTVTWSGANAKDAIGTTWY